MLHDVTGSHASQADVVRRAFREQAAAAAELGSPFMARLCGLLADRLPPASAVFAHMLSWPGDIGVSRDAVPVRLCGALHELALAGDEILRAVYPPRDVTDDALWSAILDALGRHERAIIARLASAPQTNEVRRSAALLPGFLEIARRCPGLPLVTSEIGASAGLNMNWDLYGYRLGGMSWGDPASPVTLSPIWRGPPLSEAPPLAVAGRAGCDLNPPPVRTEEGRRRVLAYIWADQPDRLALTREALRLLDRHPVAVERADAVDWLARRLEAARPGAIHVVYHTIMWQYLSRESQAAGEALLRAAGRRATPAAPLAWLRLEGDGAEPGAGLRLTTWPDGQDRLLARADFHGRWIEWRPDSAHPA